MPLRPSPASSRRLRAGAITLALALGASAAQAASFIEGTGGSALIRPPPGAAEAAPYLIPGGPRVQHVVDLGTGIHAGIDANDFAFTDDLLLIATGEGLLVLRLQTGDTPRPAGRAPTGPLSAVVAGEAGRAWVTGPDGLTAIDLSTPEAPRVAARYPTPVEPRGLVVDGERGHLLLPHELQVLDLGADGAGIAAGPVSRHALPFEAHGLAAADGVVYIAAGESGLAIVGSAGPDAPPVVRDTGAPVLDVALDGERIYLAHGAEGLSVLGRGADDGPDWLGELRGTQAIAGIRARGARALAHSGDGDLFLLDVDNPRAMAFTALLRGGDCCEAYRHAAGGAVALAGGRLIAFDVTEDPPALSNEGLAFGQGVNYGGQRRVTIEDDLAYVADWFSGLHIYDLATPGRPLLLSSLHTGGSPKGVVVRDGLAYVADDDHGLRIVDIGDPRRPREVSRLPLPGLAYTPVLAGDRLYVAVHHGGVAVVDVADPAAPALAAHYDTPGKSWSLRVRDDIAWVADDDAGLLIMDIGDGDAPRLLGRFDPGGQVEEVVIDGAIAWLAVYDLGVLAVDVSDPAAPVQVAQVRTRGNPRGLALRDDLLFVADWLAGITVLDISDPVTPRILGRRGTDGAAWGLALHGDTAFVADWWGGISLLDVADPARPAPTGRYPLREAVRAVAAAGRFAFVAQGDGGLQVFDIANALNPTWVTGIELEGASDVLIAGDRAFVLHADGWRVTVVEVAEPFQARALKGMELAHRAHTLRPTGDGGALALGKGGWSRIDPDARATRLGGAAPVDAWTIAGRTLVVDRDGLLRVSGADGGAGTVVAQFPAVGAVHGDADRMVVQVPGEGLRVLATGMEGGIEEVARVAFDGSVDALHVAGDDILIASGRTLRTVRIETEGGWHVSGTYEAMEAVTGVTMHDGTVYLAGSSALRALEPLPAIGIEATPEGLARITVPPGLPPGAYDIAAGRVADAAGTAPVLLRNAFTVEPLRFGAMRSAPAQ